MTSPDLCGLMTLALWMFWFGHFPQWGGWGPGSRKASLVKAGGVMGGLSWVWSSLMADIRREPWESRGSRLDTEWLMTLLCCALEFFLSTFCLHFNPDGWLLVVLMARSLGTRTGGLGVFP